MNKLTVIVLVFVVAVAAIPLARGVDNPRVPPNVAEKNWVAMGESAGFVMTGAANDMRDGLKSSPNVMKGYFMIRIRGTWVRVDVTPGTEAQRL